jgi:phosphatidylglycerol:prolipoprotein diacylglycerol transferase
MYPILFRIGDIVISSFSVMVLIAFLVAYKAGESEFRRKGLNENLVDLLLIACVIGGIGGAKVFFLMQNVTLSEFIADPIRYISSGLTFQGGFLCALILIWAVLRIKKVNFWLAGDAIAPALVIGYSIGRIGCFLVGDDYGTPSNLPWAMAFPKGSPPTYERVHPTQIYETLIMTGVFVFLWKIRKKDKPAGWLTGIAFILMGVERFLVEFIRNTTPSFIPGISMAQLISIGIITVGILKLVQIRNRAGKTAELEA